MPVRALHLSSRNRAEAGVGDELVRAGQDADGVELDSAEPPEHGRHAALAGLGADEAPCACSVIVRASSGLSVN